MCVLPVLGPGISSGSVWLVTSPLDVTAFTENSNTKKNYERNKYKFMQFLISTKKIALATYVFLSVGSQRRHTFEFPVTGRTHP